jgi:hypothetical protein
MICNNFYQGELPNNVSWCKILTKITGEVITFEDNLVDESYPWHHDPEKLKSIVIRSWEEMKDLPE